MQTAHGSLDLGYQKIKKFINSTRKFRVSHIYRGPNMCANMLANIGCEQGSSSIVYEQSLSLLRQALLSNVRARGFYPILVHVWFSLIYGPWPCLIQKKNSPN